MAKSAEGTGLEPHAGLGRFRSRCESHNTLATMLCLSLLGCALAVLAAKPPPSPGQTDDPTRAGDIRGTLTALRQYGPEGWDVYIPGRSFFARTGTDATFLLNYVPPGAYTIVVSRQGFKVREIHASVTSGKLTDLGNVELIVDADQDTFFSDVDCDDSDPSIHPSGIEVCNGKDDDCDGLIDEDVGDMYYPDMDGDGYGDALQAMVSCTNSGPPYVLAGGDCDDGNPTINPGAEELCDAKDNDCDGLFDEGLRKTYYRDFDEDGWGDEGFPAESAVLSGDGCQPSVTVMTWIQTRIPKHQNSVMATTTIATESLMRTANRSRDISRAIVVERLMATCPRPERFTCPSWCAIPLCCASLDSHERIWG